MFEFNEKARKYYRRSPVTQVVVYPTSKQIGVRFLSQYQWKFSKYFNRGSGGSKPTLNWMSPHNNGMPPVAGQITWGFLGDLERFVCTDSGRLSKPVKGREYKLIHTYIYIYNTVEQ